MKLKVLDQIVITAVQTDVLRRGDVINVTKALAAEIMSAHPQVFVTLGTDDDADPAPVVKEPQAKPAIKPKGTKK
jgi:hypothetical protein